jgi:hypothetical protein
MKKWLPVLIEYFFGVLTFIGYTGGLLGFSFLFLKPLVDKIGKNSREDEFLTILVVIILTLLLLPIGNIFLYKQFKNAGKPEIAKGIVLGLLLTLVGLCIIVSLDEIERNAALQPHSEEYLNFQQELLLKEATAAEQEKERERQEWENYNKQEYARNDSLKKAKDSLQTDKDWQKAMR